MRRMKSLNFFLFFLVSFTICCKKVECQDCTVILQNRTSVVGTVGDTADPSRNICSYLGIPFASPPVGSLRFQSPQPYNAMGDTFNATKLPNWCPQSGSPPPGITISEDCLYLNVYQPNIQNITNSVMIWFHGGGFISGDTLPYYTPKRLLARGDIILIVVYYRLGVLGFLSTGDEFARGNFGLKDQAFAIRWVHENIRSFGGDPEKVTVFGESSGSSSALYQMMSPLNKGMISGVIAQSRAELKTLDSNPAESARAMAKRHNCSTTSTRQIVDCLRALSWEEIIQKQEEYLLESHGNGSIAYGTLTPVVEPDLPGAFIIDEPINIIKSGALDNNIPVMLGTTKHEGSSMLASQYVTRIGPLKLDQDPEYMRNELVPDLLKLFGIQGDEANRAVASTFELAYLSGVNRSSWNESMPGLVDIMSVLTFKSELQATAELLSELGFKVYLYSLEHHSKNSIWDMYFGSVDVPIEHGVTHGDDMMYLFEFPTQFSPEDQAFSDIMCDLWINFANGGNPTPMPNEQSTQWPVYNSSAELYMKLNGTPVVLSNYRSSWRPNGFEWN